MGGRREEKREREREEMVVANPVSLLLPSATS